MDRSPTPPALAVRWLRWRLPQEWAEPVIGDLTEEYEECLEARGRTTAALEFWWEALTLRAGKLRRGARRLRRAQTLRYGVDAPERSATGIFNRTVVEMFGQDVRLAVRRLMGRKGFTAVALVSLAVGIGANTTGFSLVNSIFLRGSGVAEPDRVVQLFRQVQVSPYWSMSEVEYRAIREELGGLLETVTILQPNTGNMEAAAGPEVVLMNIVGPDFFRTLGRPPVLGRGFSVEEHEVDDAYPVVILAHGFWERSFGADPGIVGSEVILNARRYTVVGVSDPEYRGPAGLSSDVFVPMGTMPHLKNDSEESLVWTGYGRMRDEVTVEQVRAALDAVGARLTAARPPDASPIAFSAVLDTGVGIHPNLDQSIRPMAALSLGAGMLVLLVACTNLAGFLLAQGTDRKKEFAIRLALGAERRQVVRQLGIEALLLGLAGGALGIAFAFYLNGLLSGLQPPLGVPINLSLALDYRVLSFALFLVLFASAVFGLLPALQNSRPDVAPTLRDESAGSGEGRAGSRSRRLIVMAQVTLSMVILVAAGLFVRSLQTQLATDPGFRTEGISIVSVHPGPSGYESDDLGPLYDRILESVGGISGIEQVALASRLPLQVLNWHIRLAIPGVEPPAGEDGFSFEVGYVTPDFFDLMDIAIVRGRGLGAQDGPEAPRTLIVNEALARRFFDGDPIGRTVTYSGDTSTEFTIVGVAAHADVDRLGEGGNGVPFVYLPMAQAPQSTARVVARGSLPASRMAALTQAAIKEIDADLFIPEVGTIRDHMGVFLYLPRLGTLLLVSFGLAALVLSAIGLYGVVSFTVARRTREVGIRMSLGARSEEVVALMMRGGLRLVLTGAAIGILGALAAGRLMQGFLFGIPSWDPITLTAVPLILIGVGLLASWLPARRASRVDPVKALRTE